MEPRGLRAGHSDPEPGVGRRAAVRGRDSRPLRVGAHPRRGRRALRGGRGVDGGEPHAARVQPDGGRGGGSRARRGIFHHRHRGVGAARARGEAVVGDGARDRRRLPGAVRVRAARAGFPVVLRPSDRAPVARGVRRRGSGAGRRAERRKRRKRGRRGGAGALGAGDVAGRVRPRQLPVAGGGVLCLRFPHRVHHHASARASLGRGGPVARGARGDPRRAGACGLGARSHRAGERRGVVYGRRPRGEVQQAALALLALLGEGGVPSRSSSRYRPRRSWSSPSPRRWACSGSRRCR